MLSLVIPFYNDEGCPTKFVKELKKEFKGIDYELILVDDCSADSTPQEIDSLKSKNIRVVYNKKNKGYGGAIMTGLDIGKGDILGFTCGDGEISAKDVVRVYKKMGNRGVIKAVRRNRQDGLSRKIISIVFNRWSKLRFGVRIPDINGYPLYMKKEIYDELEDIRKDWLFNIDLLRKLSKKGHKIHGHVVMHKKRFSAESKMNFKRISKFVFRYVKYK